MFVPVAASELPLRLGGQAVDAVSLILIGELRKLAAECGRFVPIDGFDGEGVCILI